MVAQRREARGLRPREDCGSSRVAVCCLAAVLALGACGGRSKTIKVKLPPPINPTRGWTQVGIASWYGHPYHGRQAANGEIYDMNKMTAAHKRLKFETWLEVRNMSNGRRTQVRITDRGPFVGKRIIDLSRAAAAEIGMIATGTARVRLKKIRPPRRSSQRARNSQPSGPASQAGSKRFDLQIGAFRARRNAQALAKKVRSHGHRAAVKRNWSGGQAQYRVLVTGGNQQTASAKLRELRNQGFEAVLRPRGG